MEINTAALTGDLVRMRELRDADLPRMIEWWHELDMAIHQTSGPITPRPAGDLSDMFRSWSRNPEGDAGLSVVTRESDEFIGHAALFGATPVLRCGTLAVMIGRPYQNRGFGSDVVRVMLRYGFAELGLHRIQLNVNGYNPRAIATYVKAGFVEEGRRREAVYRSGAWHDHVQMGILDREWFAAHPS
jgi:RimJ/RimL family protein N-acetyltransferase